MNLRQQIVQDHIERTAKILNKADDEAFLIFAHSIYVDNSIHSFNPKDNVDGGQDKQIDTITIEENNQEATLYITQVKNEEGFSSNRIIHIRNGLKWIFNKSSSDIDTLSNTKFKDRIKEYRNIQRTFGPSNIHVRIAYITKGLKSDLSEECEQEIKTIFDEYNNDTFASFNFETWGADELVDCINSQEKTNKKINIDLKINYDANTPSLIKYHTKGLTGIICTTTAHEIARVVLADKKGFVFDLNIRRYLGNLGGVNKEILSTCTSSDISFLFWFLNNGITIVCDKVDPVTDPDNAIVKIKNLQIVNGCQTASSLGIAAKEGLLKADTKVLLRIYETNDMSLVDKIVLTTNNQNKITGRNLRANDKFQIDIEKGVLLYGYYLERKPRQYENETISPELILPNDDVAVSYLGIVLKKCSDSRSRKYKVWSEYYDKIFNGKIIEPYLIAVLIYRSVENFLILNYLTEPDDTRRYLARNASFHISRITSFLWRNGDDWNNTTYLKEDLNLLKNNSRVLEQLIPEALKIIESIIESNPRFKSDLNSTLKSADLDQAIEKELYSRKIKRKNKTTKNKI